METDAPRPEVAQEPPAPPADPHADLVRELRARHDHTGIAAYGEAAAALEAHRGGIDDIERTHRSTLAKNRALRDELAAARARCDKLGPELDEMMRQRDLYTAERNAARDLAAQLKRERDEARFRPGLGDNHHNANACPYCRAALKDAK